MVSKLSTSMSLESEIRWWGTYLEGLPDGPVSEHWVDEDDSNNGKYDPENGVIDGAFSDFVLVGQSEYESSDGLEVQQDQGDCQNNHENLEVKYEPVAYLHCFLVSWIIKFIQKIFNLT